MKFFLAVQGSFGDINPCAGIAVGLRERGHEVVFLTSEYYRPWLEAFGIETISTVSREEHLRVTSNPDFSHPLKAYRLLWDLMLRAGRPEYQAIRDRYDPGRSVVLTRLWNMGSRIAAEKLRLPIVNLVVSPDEIPSIHRPVRYQKFASKGVRKWLLVKINRGMDAFMGPHLDQFRRELDLPPIESGFIEWCTTTDRMVGLFPEWFAPRQADWPGIRLTAFPLFDGAWNQQLPAAVEEYLANGEPPVLVNAFSSTQTAGEFFFQCVDAVRRIGARAILLSAFPQNIPDDLPPGIAYFGYQPHSLLLSRSAAIIHHGGIGTVAGALRAGVPQLIVPLNFDNPYHAARVTAMGVGRIVSPWRYDAGVAARELKALLSSDTIREACSGYAARIRADAGIGAACQAIEEMYSPANRDTVARFNSAY